MTEYLGAGIVLGLSAGFSPGPLLALVISQTLRYGMREGIKAAAAPLVTDVPIILLALLVLSRLASFRPVLGLISLSGGMFVAWLAVEGFRSGRLPASAPAAVPQSLGRGVLVNLLSPHPYLFWLTVGAPTVLKGWGEGGLSAIAFVAGFLGSLVGAKVAVSFTVGRSRHLLDGRTYGYLMKALAVLLLAFAVLLVRDGFRLLG